MKNFSLEAMYIELQDVKKRVIESNERRERQGRIGNYPLIGFRKSGDRKREDEEKAEAGESSDGAEANEPEEAKATIPGESS
jgi:hypothetical protein